MSSVFLTAGSVTYAQRMQRALQRGGISASIERPERELTDKGCAYAVVISEGFIAEAIEVLRKNNIPPMRVVINENGVYRVIEI